MDINNDKNRIGMAVMDNSYSFTVADDAVSEFFGSSHITDFLEYIHPEDKDNFADKVENGFSVRDNYICCRLKTAEAVYMPVVIFIKKSTAGAKGGFVLNFHTIDHLIKSYKELEVQNNGLKSIVNLMEPPYTFVYHCEEERFEVYAERDFVAYNDKIDRLTDYLLGKNIIELSQAEAVEGFIAKMKSGAHDSKYSLKADLPDYGKVMLDIATSNVYRAGRVEVTVGVITIRTYNKHSAGSVEVDFDPLTNLYNRTSIKAIAENALKTAEGIVTFIMLDLDHFKEANDNYGHMFGDEVIFNTANIIKETVGRRGYVGRLGGDEFFIVLVNAINKKEDLRAIMRALRTKIEWEYKDKLGDVKLTASMGGASYPMDADNYNDLFMLADNALYTAKTKGRNRYVIYYKELHGSLEDIKVGDNRLKIHVHVPDSKKLEFAHLAVEVLTDGGKAEINTVLDDVLHYFSVNEAIIYRVSDDSVMYSAVNEEKEPDNICSYLKAMKPAFKGRNIVYFGDIESLKTKYPDFYDFSMEKNIKSVYAYLYMDEKNKPKYYGVLIVKNIPHKWSELEANLMGIVFKIIGETIDSN